MTHTMDNLHECDWWELPVLFGPDSPEQRRLRFVIWLRDNGYTSAVAADGTLVWGR